MYRMIIVDDESWIRERIRHTFNWNEVGVEVVGEACDGEEALKITNELHPDIILTDIRMPCIDGLEFVKLLRECSNKAKVIIISGFGDFEYAQKAIKLGAFDYVLKPFEDELLINIIKACTQELDKDKHREALFEKAKRQVKESHSILKEKFFIKLINGYFSCGQDIINESGYLGINDEGLDKICFVVQLDENDDFKTGEKWDIHLTQFVLCNIVKDFIGKLGVSELFFVNTGEVVCLVFSKNTADILVRQVMSISNGIRKMIKKVLGRTVTIGIGRTCKTLFDVSSSYKSAKQALQYKTYFGTGRIYDIRSLEINKSQGYSRCYDIEALINSIKIGNKEDSFKNLESLITEITKTDKDLLPVDLKLLFIDISNSLFKIVLETNNRVEELSFFSLNFLEKLNKLQTAEQMHKSLKESVVKIIELIEKSSGSRKRKVIEKAISYIKQHYNEQLSLNDISDKFFLNASYFSKIFSEETGESFTKYLMRLRIQKAIELMNDPTIKIYEIAQKVGYDDVQYFTKVFKSIHGVAPMQYREKIK